MFQTFAGVLPAEPNGPERQKNKSVVRDMTLKRKIHLLTLLRLLLIPVAGAGLFARDNQLSFSKLSVREGLSNSSVYALFQDREGYIWAGTADGLNRFDGYSFLVFDSNLQAPYRLSGEMITSIDSDPSGRLWFGIQFGGIICYEPATGSFRPFLINPQTPADASNNVWVVKADNRGRIWAGTTGRGLFCFDPETETFTPVLTKEKYGQYGNVNEISAVILDHNGDIRAATVDAGVFIIDRNDLTAKPFSTRRNENSTLPVRLINTLFEDSHQRFWIGTRQDGFYILQRDGLLKEHHGPGQGADEMTAGNIRCFMEDPQGMVWIGTDGDGLYVYDPDRGISGRNYHDPDDPESLSSNVVFSLLRSRDGVIWAGTNKGGLNGYDSKRDKFNRINSRDLPPNRALNYKVLISVFEDREGNTWFGTDGGGLNRYSAGDRSLKVYKNNPADPSSISGNAIKVVYQDSQGRIWAGSYGSGLNLYRRQDDIFQRIKTDGEPEAHDIWDMTEDPEGNLWVATLNEGLFIIRQGTLRLVPAGRQEIGNHLFCLRWDTIRNGLWIGTNRGLRFLDPRSGTVRSWIHSPGDSLTVSGNEIKTIFSDREGTLWIGTRRGGLNRMVPETGIFTVYNTDNGLGSNTIASIQEDESGRLWVSTSMGLSIFDRNSGRWSNFTVEDGLRNNEFLSESSCRLSNGAFLFGGVNGYDLIEPGSITLNSYLPEVSVTRILINNKEVYPFFLQKEKSDRIAGADRIVLNHNDRSLTLQLSALSYTHPEKNRYAYRLSGLDDNWNELGFQRIITFTGLPAGTYLLQLKSANNDGRWNDTPKTIQIQVLPPWWSSLLFRIFLTAVIFAVLLLLVLWRISFVKKQQLRLEMLVEKRTRELESEKKITEEQNRRLMEIQKQILRQNEEISLQKENIERISEQARKADQEKLVFFTNISHEIRTPLTLIIGPLEELMADYSLNKQVRNQLGITYRNSLSLLSLVNQILDFRKIETNNYPYRPVSADIVPLLKEIFVSFSQKAVNQQIAFTFSTSHPEIQGMFDTEKIDKIVFNLLSNAFRFTPAGGKVDLGCRARGEHDEGERRELIISVSDSGTGIESEYHGKIFERFFQVPGAAKGRQEGTGIGLSLVKSLVEIQNGTISLDSEPGKGSRFTVILPYTAFNRLQDESSVLTEVIPEESWPVGSEAPETEVSLKRKGGKEKKEKPRVLLCEDHAELLDFLTGRLQDDYRVYPCSNGNEALELAGKSAPDLIVSDVMMPGMNGIDLCRAIKESLETSHIPVILLTARSGVEYKLEGLDAGADDYLYKPFRLDELKARIDNLIRSRILLRRKFSTSGAPDPAELAMSSPDEKFLENAIRIVEREMGSSSFNVAGFVREMKMSRTLVHVKLKELTDTSASGFIRIMRLKKAARLLSLKTHTVSEVAYLVGFSDPKYFHKCFREHYGITPGEFMEPERT
ncbi:MAG: two-component regulator propeller domain-containing protein [Bacteroidota bacterium]